MLQAVVFDFDGVIVDTEHLHYEAFNKILEPLGLGLTWEDYVRDLIGFDDRGAFTWTLQKAGRSASVEEVRALVERKAAIFNSMVSGGSPTPFPGSVELIRALSGRIPLALCTGALRSDIEPIIHGLAIANAFDAIVTADDVSASKPDPMSYRLAVDLLAERYNREIIHETALAIEDTPTGIASAKGAGLKVLGLTNSYDREYLDRADFVRDTLVGLNLDALRELMVAP
ncbi:MAG: HAD family phosphatase [Kiritimatiellae bacterium]|nr:HAD family phosphatase [Kiritimatiellia bacterium]